MKYICVTNIDAGTGIVCTAQPMRTGPVYPNILGLQLSWADQSTWPVPCKPDGSYVVAPKYYGTCDDAADTTVSGVLAVLTEQEWNDRKRQEMYARRPFASWVFDEATFVWSSPTPYPTDGKSYRWDEPTTSWTEA